MPKSAAFRYSVTGFIALVMLISTVSGLQRVRSAKGRQEESPIVSRRVRVNRKIDSQSTFGKFGAPHGAPSCPASTQCSPIDACTIPSSLSAFDAQTAHEFMGRIHVPCSVDPFDYPKAAEKNQDGVCCPIVTACPELKACRPPTTCDPSGEALPKKAPKNTNLEFNVQLTKCEPPKRILEANPNTFGYCCSTISSQLNSKDPDLMAEKRLDRDTFGLRLASQSRIREEAKMKRKRRNEANKS